MSMNRSSTARMPRPRYETVVGFRGTADVLAGLDATTADEARQRLRATLAAHETNDGVRFDARTWIVTASR